MQVRTNKDDSTMTTKPKARRCQWCGEPFHSDHPTKLFCTPKHKKAWENYTISRGKVLLPIALAWRTMRGRKGVGAEALKEMTAFLDKCAAELNAQGAQPVSHHFTKTRASGTGVTNWKDAERNRPSRIDKDVSASQ